VEPTVSGPLTASGELLSGLACFGRLHLLETVESTNEFALALASTGEPAVVVARRQTRGKGRYQRDWFSNEDSLTFSHLVFATKPDFPAAGAIPQLAGFALCCAISEKADISARIRWPNDIVYRDRKLAGILCEARRSAVAVGVGLNVNQTSFPETLPEALSLRQATGRTFDKLELLRAFLETMAVCIDKAGKGQMTQLIEEIRGRSAILHRRVEVKTMLRTHIGTVVDLDSDGRIVLRTDAGRVMAFNAGQVRELR
jgi:BirA family biotin operon repressor/biotin-[acetyl-CoA-carboxylase] ligase